MSCHWSNPDDDVIANPSEEGCILPAKLDDGTHMTRGNLTLPRTLQPVIVNSPWLSHQIREALMSADTESSVFGTLTRHEAGMLHLLFRPYSQQDNNFYELLQQQLHKVKRLNGLSPLVPALHLAMTALNKMPVLSSNVFCAFQKDLTEIYPLGHVFAWHGFLRCYYNMETLHLEECSRQKPSTTFSIISNSGRVVGPLFSNQTIPPVIVMPGSHFQVISVIKPTENNTIIFLKEVDPPGTYLDPLLSRQDPSSIHPYWESVLSCTKPNELKGILRAIRTACNAGEIALLTRALCCLADIPKLTCSVGEAKEIISEILLIIKLYKTYSVFQAHACIALKNFAQSIALDEDDVLWTKVIGLTLQVLHYHIEADSLVLNALDLFTVLFWTCKENELQNVLDAVLIAMRQHSHSKNILLSGCEFINNLSSTNHWMTLVKEQDARVAILSAIRLHREDLPTSVKCWRALLIAGNQPNNNNNNKAPNGLPRTSNKEDFIVLIKHTIRMYRKHPDVQVEGLKAVFGQLQTAGDKGLLHSDRELLDLAVSALRIHCQNAEVVEFACGILSQIAKAPDQAHQSVTDGAIGCVLSAMNHHFNVPSVQGYGCKFLRTVAMSGLRPYLNASNDCSGDGVGGTVAKDIPDYRLKIIEAGGREIVLSAMRTHLDEVGVQRQGSLALRTLVVSAANLVETNGITEISVVLDALTKHLTNTSVLVAALRAIVILIISQVNKVTFIQKSGLFKTLQAIRNFPHFSKVQEEGLQILANLSSDINCALSLLERGFLRDIISAMDLFPTNVTILKASCNLVSSLCSVSLDGRLEEDMLPHVLLVERGAFERIEAIMTKYLLDAELQMQGCRALYALAVPPVSSSMLDVTDIFANITSAMTRHPDHCGVLQAACGAMERLVIIQDAADTHVPTEAIDNVLLAIKSHPHGQNIQIVALKTVDAIITKRPSSTSHIVANRIVSLTLSSMRRFLDEPTVLDAGLRLLYNLLVSEKSGGVFKYLVSLVVPTDNRLWKEFCSEGGLDLVKDVIQTHVSFGDIVWFGGHILICNRAGGFSHQFAKELVELSEQIESTYKEDDQPIQALYHSIKILVNKQVLAVS